MTNEIATTRKRAADYAREGITTANQYIACMSSLMAEVLDNEVASREATTVIKAGNGLLKAAEMQHRFGRMSSKGEKVLAFSPPEVPTSEQDDPTEVEIRQLQARLAALQARKSASVEVA